MGENTKIVGKILVVKVSEVVQHYPTFYHNELMQVFLQSMEGFLLFSTHAVLPLFVLHVGFI